MGNLASFISLLTAYLLALIIMRCPHNTLKWLISSLIILDLVIVGTYFCVEKINERLQATSVEVESCDDIVRNSIPSAKEVWLTGTGPGSFYSCFLQHQTTEYEAFYDHVHNEYVQFLTEYGLVPSLMLLAMVHYVMWQAINVLRNSKRKFDQGLALAY